MSNPIALKAEDDGKVYAYLCGNCRNLHAGGESMSEREEPLTLCVDLSRECAERCCRCRMCGIVIGLRYSYDVCDACRPAEQARKQQLAEEMEVERARSRTAYLAAIAQAKDQCAAEKICSLIHDWSEDNYAASWLCGGEYMLWEQLVEPAAPTPKDPSEIPWGDLCPEEINKLRQLSEQAGGWWYYADGLGQLFVPTDKWLEMYAAHVAMRKASEAEDANEDSDSNE